NAISLIDNISVNAGNEVKLNEIARFRRTLDSVQRAKALTQTRQLFFNGIVVYFGVVDNDFKTVVLRKCKFGASFNLENELQLALGVLCVNPLFDVSRWAPHGARVRLGKGGLEERIE